MVVSDPNDPYFYRVLLDWLAERFPEIRSLFELRMLPCRVRDWSLYALHVPWLQDPVQQWSRATYRWAGRLADECDEHGIPVINRVDRLSNAGKSAAGERMASIGIRTPKMALIGEPSEFRETLLGIGLPLIIREDWGHGGKLYRADTAEEARALRLTDLQRPVAVELIDVESPDGLFRKYRSTVCGQVSIPQSLHVSKHWCVRGSREQTVYSEALREEEIAFANLPDRHRDLFVRAARALGLDLVAFDYSFDREGELVVWEANPYPTLHLIEGRRAYRNVATERVLAAMTMLYLDVAGLGSPRELLEALGPHS